VVRIGEGRTLRKKKLEEEEGRSVEEEGREKFDKKGSKGSKRRRIGMLLFPFLSIKSISFPFFVIWGLFVWCFVALPLIL